MDKKVYEMLGYPADFKYVKSLGVGVEIEVEAQGDALPRPAKTWRKEGDGSLRGLCCEYVSNGPIPVDKVEKECADLLSSIHKANSKVLDSFRAGVHVHINCLNLTLKQTANFAALFYVFEDLLLEWCGEERYGNYFCLSGTQAEEGMRYGAKLLANRDVYWDRGNEDNVRYSSMNFASLTKYGTLEFRSLGTHPEFSTIAPWCKMLQSLKEASINLDVEKMHLDYSVEGALEITKRYFSPWWVEKLSKMVDFEARVLDGIRISQDFYHQTKG